MIGGWLTVCLHAATAVAIWLLLKHIDSLAAPELLTHRGGS
jgi:hypothetical protein